LDGTDDARHLLLASRIEGLLAKLSKVKKDNPIEGGWYGYDIMSNLVHLDRLLSERTARSSTA